MNEPLFILGCPRSGTTLLAGLLENTDYGAPVETHFITKYYKKIDNYGNLMNKSNFVRLIKDILNERAVAQWKLNINAEKYYDDCEEKDFRRIIDLICMLRAKKYGNKSWGDKTPKYILDVPIIYQLFPKSKYIYIVRDGRDVALSLFEREWGPNNVLTCAEYWKRCNAENAVIDKLKSRNQLYFLRYEDLLDNAEKILPDIYTFLNEQYDEKELSRLISRIKKGNHNKWKSKMNTHQVKVFESIAANTLKRFGYETSYKESDTTGLTKAVYNYHELLMRAKFLFKTNVIDGIKIKFFGKEPFAD